MLEQPTFTLRIDGQPWAVWTGIAVSRAIDRMSGEFEVGLGRHRDEGDITLDGTLLTGAPVDVEIDDQIVLSGFLRDMRYAYDARTASLTVSGRDKTIDLVDCAAAIDGAHEFYGETLLSVAKKIAAPYGIEVTAETDVGAPFSRLAIQPGETAFEFIERACRQRGVLAVSNGIGGMVIVRPGEVRSPGRLVYGQIILAADVAHDESELFSLYVVKGQAEPVGADTEPSVSASPSARSADATIRRYRPKVVMAENQGYDLTLAERAEWEKKMAKARAKRATYTVRGWYADPVAKTLWQPNTIVTVEDRRAQLNREMLIAGVSLLRDESGTTTRLDLVLPDAFDIQAEAEDGAGSGNSDVWVADA